MGATGIGVLNQNVNGGQLQQLKLGTAYLVRFSRSNGTKQCAIVPALRFNYTETNDMVYADTYVHTDRIRYTNLNLHSAQGIFPLPSLRQEKAQSL